MLNSKIRGKEKKSGKMVQVDIVYAKKGIKYIKKVKVCVQKDSALYYYEGVRSYGVFASGCGADERTCGFCQVPSPVDVKTV